MKKLRERILIILIAVSIITLVFSGCTSNNEKKSEILIQPEIFIGNWIRIEPPYDFEFNFTLLANGSCINMPQHTFLGDWGVTDNLLIFKYYYAEEDHIYTYRYEYVFSNSNNTLTLDSLDFPTTTTIIVERI